MLLECYKRSYQHYCNSVPQISTFSFLFSSMCFVLFLISLETASLIQWIFKRVWFSFQVFGYFPVIFLLLAFSLTTLWSENTFYMISIILNFSHCFMARDMVHLGKCPISTWKECVSLCCWLDCSINIKLMLLVDGGVEFSLYSCWFSVEFFD